MIMQPRICVVMPRNLKFSPRNATSIDLCVLELIQHSRHQSSTIILCDPVDEPFSGLQVAFIRARKNLGHILRSWFIARQIRELKPDLVIVEQHLPTAFLLARLIASPVIFHTHNFPKVARRGLFSSRYKKLYYPSLRGIMFVSHACREVFIEKFGDLIPTSVVPNGQLPYEDAAQERPNQTNCLCLSAAVLNEPHVLRNRSQTTVRAVGRHAAARSGLRALHMPFRPAKNERSLSWEDAQKKKAYSRPP